MISSIGKYALIVIILAGGVFLDLHSKHWAHDHLKGKPIMRLVPGCVELGFTENHGMVFGIFNNNAKAKHYISGLAWVRAAILLAVTVFMTVQRKQSLLYLLPFMLIWCGALGNLVDSFGKGHVIDFIHIHAGSMLDWPFFFNVADAYVCVGMVILLLSGITARKS